MPWPSSAARGRRRLPGTWPGPAPGRQPARSWDVILPADPVGGFPEPMPIIDVHTHMFTRAVARAPPRPRRPVRRPGAGPTAARRSSAANAGRVPAAGPLRLRPPASSRWTRPGIDVSIVSLTCPNVYWGGEDVSSEAAREVERVDGGGAAGLSGPDPLVRLAAVGVPGSARSRSCARSCDDGAVGVMVHRQRRRPEPDRARVRADLGGDRPARAAGARPSRRAARRRPHGHGPRTT